MVSALLSRLIILFFGTLYPAYASYKAVKRKDVREYVKWMMYWIVFAFFTAAETIADVFISWLPLYYEVKIVFIVWMLLPATRGSSILFRRFVHPWLSRNEQEIDRYIEHAKENGYHTLMRVGKQGLNMAADTFVRTALTGQNSLVQTLRRYKSMSDLNDSGAVDADLRDGNAMTQSTRSTWYSGMPNDNYETEANYQALQDQYDGRIILGREGSITEEPEEDTNANRVRATSLPHDASAESGVMEFERNRSISPGTLLLSDSSQDSLHHPSARGVLDADFPSASTAVRQGRTGYGGRVDYGSYKSNTLPRSRTHKAPPPSVEYSPWTMTTRYDEVRHYSVAPAYNPDFRRSFPDTLPYRTSTRTTARPLFSDDEDGLK